MKKVLVIPFLLSFCFAYAGTGDANDVNQLILIIIAVLLTILSVLYTISFFRKIIKERREKKAAQQNDTADSEVLN